MEKRKDAQSSHVRRPTFKKNYSWIIPTSSNAGRLKRYRDLPVSFIFCLLLVFFKFIQHSKSFAFVSK